MPRREGAASVSYNEIGKVLSGSPGDEVNCSVEIVLRGAPMGKERVRFSRATGRTFTPERTVAYEGRLALAAQHAMAGRALLEGPLAVEIVAVMPISPSWPKKRQAAARAGVERPVKKPDYDNYAKILDALNMIVWADDSQIVTGGPIHKFYGDRPMLAIRVGPAPEETIPQWALDVSAEPTEQTDDIFA